MNWKELEQECDKERVRREVVHHEDKRKLHEEVDKLKKEIELWQFELPQANEGTSRK